MNLPLDQVGGVAPAWILVVLLGALWAGLGALAFPPPPGRFPSILVGAIIGAAIGQLLGQGTPGGLLRLGDVHLVAVSLASVLLLGIVRRLAA